MLQFFRELFLSSYSDADAPSGLHRYSAVTLLRPKRSKVNQIVHEWM